MPESYNLKSAIFPTIVIALVYLVLVAYLINLGLVQDTIFGNHTLNYKINLLIALLLGLSTSMSGIGLTLLVITALLTGANTTLLLSRIKRLKSAGKLHLAVGGSSIIGIVGSGCASCGLPILSILGLSGGLAFLPLKGDEIPVISVILLAISLYFLIKTDKQSNVCNINLVKN